MAAMHLIRFPSKKEHKRAIMALLEVPRVESLGLPGVQRDDFASAATLLCGGAVPLVRQEVIERREKERAKTAFLAGHPMQ